jgi:hypothetical protein
MATAAATVAVRDGDTKDGGEDEVRFGDCAPGHLIRVIRLGALAPHDGAAFVDQQMLAGHRYRNTLTEIERGRREALRSIERAAGDVPALEIALEAANVAELAAAKALKATRAAARSRQETAAQKETLKAARAHRGEIARQLREARARIRTDPAIIAAKMEINGSKEDERGEKGGRAGEAKRGARALSGVGWGIYSRVEARADAARKALDKEGGLYDGLEPNDPRFSRWRGDGFVGAQQLVGGVTVAELLSGQDPRASIGPAVLVRQVWDPASRVHRSFVDTSGRERKGNGALRATLRVRLGKGATATWCSWVIILSRPLPKDAVVREIVVHRKMRGPREEWYVTMSVAIKSEARVQGSRGACAVDLGWRKMPDGGIRVGTWRDTDSASGEVRLPPALVSALTKAASIRSIRDLDFTGPKGSVDGGARGALVAWLRQAPGVPSWFRDATKTLHLWKSQGAFQSLVRRWAASRWDGDQEAFLAAEAWRYRDHHLWSYEEGARTRALRRRKQFYRVAAKELAARHRLLVLEDFDLRDMAERPETGTDEDVAQNEGARGQRQLVAPSELRTCLIQAFADVAKAPAANTTRTCHACSLVSAFDAEKSVVRVPECPGCGAAWDQDDNAAVNLLRWWREQGSAGQTPGGARSTEKSKDLTTVRGTRFQRARLAAEQRRAQQDTAR